MRTHLILPIVLALGAAAPLFAAGAPREGAKFAPAETAVKAPAPATKAAETAEPMEPSLAAVLLKEPAARAAIAAARSEAQRAGSALGEATSPHNPKRPPKATVERLRAKRRAASKRVGELYMEHCGRYAALISRDPLDWRARRRLGTFQADYGANLDAAEQWRQVIAIKADQAYVHNDLATLYNHMGRDMESVDLYRKAIRLRPDEPEFHFNLANVYSVHRRDVAAKFGWPVSRVFQEALRRYRAARALRPGRLEYAEAAATHYIMARFFGVKDWADDAVKDWRYCLKLELAPRDRARCLANLGRIYLRQKKDPATARKLLLEAKRLDSNPMVETLLRQAK